MEEYENKIFDIVDDMAFGILKIEMDAIKIFISNCSIADFEKLKEMDYDLSTAKNESDDTE